MQIINIKGNFSSQLYWEHNKRIEILLGMVKYLVCIMFAYARVQLTLK